MTANQRKTSPARTPKARFRLLSYQRRWVEDRSALKIAVKARQTGYSFAATLRAVLECLRRKTTWVFLSKGERQSRLLMEKVHGHIRACGAVAESLESALFEGTSLRQLEARFANGSVIYGLPANPDTARGYSGNVTLDEFAFHADAEKIYTALFPTVTRGYQLEVISTPNGQQGKFYELARAAGLAEGMPAGRPEVSAGRKLFWSGHWCDIYEAARQGMKIDIPALRAGCADETAWQQEFCCGFVSTAENFFPPDLLAACLSVEASADTPPHLLASARGARKPDFFLGIDVGRRRDRTVFWVDEQIPDVARHDGIERLAVARMVRTLDNAPFAQQLECARELLNLKGQEGLPLIRRGAIDATGIGAMLAETLQAEFGPRVEAVVFTNAVKEDLAYRTRRRMESGLVRLPDTAEVRRAFTAVKKFVTATGHLRFDAARTDAGHSDEFWAKALAELAADERPGGRASDALLARARPVMDPRVFTEAGAGWAGLV